MKYSTGPGLFEHPVYIYIDFLIIIRGSLVVYTMKFSSHFPIVVIVRQNYAFSHTVFYTCSLLSDHLSARTRSPDHPATHVIP